MNHRYDKYLVKKYAPLYQDRNASMTHTAMCWGFEVGNGWFNIIDTLSTQLCNEWLFAKHDYDRVAGRVGERRYPHLDTDEHEWNPIITEEMVAGFKAKMDEEAEKVPTAVQVKEKFGGLRFYVHGATNEQHAAIRLAEALSYRTCEVCGKPGKPNKDGGWISTRCKEHRSEY